MERWTNRSLDILYPRPNPVGGTGDLPVAVGGPPTAMRDDILLSNAVFLHNSCPLSSAGPVARRDGRVARATQDRRIAARDLWSFWAGAKKKPRNWLFSLDEKAGKG